MKSVQKCEMEKQYYYFDEAGSIDSNSNFFILGCCKTDTPEELRNSINDLSEKITNDSYFAFERTKFIKQGFHACENHFDIRARFYGLISTLNVRFYMLLVDKKTQFFQNMHSNQKSTFSTYNIFTEKLLRDRLVKHRYNHNVIIFEEYGNKPNKWRENIEEVVFEIKEYIYTTFGVNISYEVKVHTKSDENIAIIDYINFLFVQFFEHGKIDRRMLENFRIVEPKIALIYKMDKDLFYSSKNRIDLQRY